MLLVIGTTGNSHKLLYKFSALRRPGATADCELLYTSHELLIPAYPGGFRRYFGAGSGIVLHKPYQELALEYMQQNLYTYGKKRFLNNQLIVRFLICFLFLCLYIVAL